MVESYYYYLKGINYYTDTRILSPISVIHEEAVDDSRSNLRLLAREFIIVSPRLREIDTRSEIEYRDERMSGKFFVLRNLSWERPGFEAAARFVSCLPVFRANLELATGRTILAIVKSQSCPKIVVSRL